MKILKEKVVLIILVVNWANFHSQREVEALLQLIVPILKQRDGEKESLHSS